MKSVLLLVLFFSSNSFIAQNSSKTSSEDDYRALMNLLDYLGRDYENAVSDNKVINEFEYEEMLEFSSQTLISFDNLHESSQIESSAQLRSKLMALRDSIDAKAATAAVKNQSEDIKQALLDLALYPNSAQEWPDLVNALKLFNSNCSSCHGISGDGNGLAGKSLIPAPSNFLNSSLAKNLSPLQAFNTIKMGLPGTAMTSYKHLSDNEIWSLSFYILSLRYDSSQAVKLSKSDFNISLDHVSLMSENELIDKYGNQSNFSIDQVRNYRLIKEESRPMQVAIDYLNEVLVVYKVGSKKHAINLALKAYLEGVEPFEKRIAASDANLLGELEASMMEVRSSIKKSASLNQLEKTVEMAIAVIKKGQDLISNQERSASFTAFLAASILIREGLEAFLIIIAILGILKSLNARRAANWVHGGWVSAILLGGIGWFYVDGLMSWDVQNRELFEGLIALFAVIILLFMGFWLHSKTEINKWKQFVETKIKVLVERNNLLGLSAFAFMVVFREAFESVIFLSSLRVDSGEDRSLGIWIGIVVACIIVFGLSWGILKIFNKIPLRKVFLYSSVMIAALAIILTGDGVHALQEGGIVSATSSPLNIRIPLLGIYPTLECLSAQLVSIFLIIGLWQYSSRKKVMSI